MQNQNLDPDQLELLRGVLSRLDDALRVLDPVTGLREPALRAGAIESVSEAKRHWLRLLIPKSRSFPSRQMEAHELPPGGDGKLFRQIATPSGADSLDRTWHARFIAPAKPIFIRQGSLGCSADFPVVSLWRICRWLKSIRLLPMHRDFLIRQHGASPAAFRAYCFWHAQSQSCCGPYGPLLVGNSFCSLAG